MQNKVSNGAVSAYLNNTENTIMGGDICVFSVAGAEYVGVAIKDIAPSSEEICEVHGIFSFKKAVGVLAQGTPVYVSQETGVQVAQTGSVYVGRVECAAPSESSIVDVRINFMPVIISSASVMNAGNANGTGTPAKTAKK